MALAHIHTHENYLVIIIIHIVALYIYIYICTTLSYTRKKRRAILHAYIYIYIYTYICVLFLVSFFTVAQHHILTRLLAYIYEQYSSAYMHDVCVCVRVAPRSAIIRSTPFPGRESVAAAVPNDQQHIQYISTSHRHILQVLVECESRCKHKKLSRFPSARGGLLRGRHYER